jgi:RecG-like helicase
VKRSLLGEVQRGAQRLVVSTHSAFYTAGCWDKLGLVVIDEQHK